MDSSASVGVVYVLLRVITSFFLFLVFSVYADQSPALLSPASCFSQSSTSLCLLSVEYPLEAPDYSDISCGYPGFEAGCNLQSGQRPFINISNHIYHVLDISYESKEIHLVDIDVEGGGCPQPKRSFSFPSSPSWVSYNLSRNNGNITVFYNCSRVPANAEQHLLCSKEDTSTPPSYVFNDYEFMWFTKRFDWYNNCAQNVVVPVSITSEIGYNYSFAIQQGFYMSWSATDWCEDCERSGGHCWSTQNSTVTGCSCDNGNSYNTTCPRHRGLSTGLKIGIGILSGIGGVFLVALLVFCKRSNHSFLSLSYWRNKMKSPI